MRQRISVRVDEHHVPAFGKREVVVVKADNAAVGLFFEPDKRRDARRYFGRRKRACERDFNRLRKFSRLRRGPLVSIRRGDDGARTLPRRIGAGLDSRRRGERNRSGIRRAGICRRGAVGRIVNRRIFRRTSKSHICRRIKRDARLWIEHGVRCAVTQLVTAHGRSIGKVNVVKINTDSRICRARANSRRVCAQVVVTVRRVDEQRVTIGTISADDFVLKTEQAVGCLVGL